MNEYDFLPINSELKNWKIWCEVQHYRQNIRLLKGFLLQLKASNID